MSGRADDSPDRLYPYGVRHTEVMIADLSRRAYEYRAQVLRMVYERKTGHLAGAFSIAEILTALYFHHLAMEWQLAPAWPWPPDWPDRAVKSTWFLATAN